MGSRRHLYRRPVAGRLIGGFGGAHRKFSRDRAWMASACGDVLAARQKDRQNGAAFCVVRRHHSEVVAQLRGEPDRLAGLNDINAWLDRVYDACAAHDVWQPSLVVAYGVDGLLSQDRAYSLDLALARLDADRLNASGCVAFACSVHAVRRRLQHASAAYARIYARLVALQRDDLLAALPWLAKHEHAAATAQEASPR